MRKTINRVACVALVMLLLGASVDNREYTSGLEDKIEALERKIDRLEYKLDRMDSKLDGLDQSIYSSGKDLYDKLRDVEYAVKSLK